MFIGSKIAMYRRRASGDHKGHPAKSATVPKDAATVSAVSESSPSGFGDKSLESEDEASAAEIILTIERRHNCAHTDSQKKTDLTLEVALRSECRVSDLQRHIQKEINEDWRVPRGCQRTRLPETPRGSQGTRLPETYIMELTCAGQVLQPSLTIADLPEHVVKMSLRELPEHALRMPWRDSDPEYTEKDLEMIAASRCMDENGEKRRTTVVDMKGRYYTMAGMQRERGDFTIRADFQLADFAAPTFAPHWIREREHGEPEDAFCQWGVTVAAKGKLIHSNGMLPRRLDTAGMYSRGLTVVFDETTVGEMETKRKNR